MALSKSIATPYSTNAIYWRLSDVHFDLTALRVIATMKGYASQAASAASATPLSETTLSYVAASLPAMEGITWNAIYNFIKAQPMFAGATDV